MWSYHPLHYSSNHCTHFHFCISFHLKIVIFLIVLFPVSRIHTVPLQIHLQVLSQSKGSGLLPRAGSDAFSSEAECSVSARICLNLSHAVTAVWGCAKNILINNVHHIFLQLKLNLLMKRDIMKKTLPLYPCMPYDSHIGWQTCKLPNEYWCKLWITNGDLNCVIFVLVASSCSVWVHCFGPQ